MDRKPYLVAFLVFAMLASPCVALADQQQVIKALEPCASQLLKVEPGEAGQDDEEYSRRYEGQRLEHNFFVLLDKWNNQLYVFTPYFAGKSPVTNDVSVPLVDRKYGVRIPYQPY